MLEGLVPELSLPENAPLLAQLEAMVAARRMPHAVIVEGADASACDRVAQLCARAFLCTCETPLAGECRSCRLMTAYGGHADVVRVEGTGKTGAIGVDGIRALQGQAQLLPADATGQVYLLEDCDVMQPAAQNALLKLFEEPPPGVMFVLTCRSSTKLLETIRSRGCLLRLTAAAAQADKADDEAREQAERFAVALVSERDADALMLMGQFSRPAGSNPAVRRELGAFLAALRGVLRDALVIGAGSGDILPERTKGAETIARTLAPERVSALLDELPLLEQALKANAPITLLTAAICVRLRRAAAR